MQKSIEIFNCACCVCVCVCVTFHFSDRPVTYLYNTLHYYERKLRDRPSLKRRLVSAVLGSLREIRAPGWALSEAYQIYMTRSTDTAVAWIPELDYYIRLVQRIVESKAITYITYIVSIPYETHLINSITCNFSDTEKKIC